MARPKGSKNKIPVVAAYVEAIDLDAVVPTPISLLSVDYPSEGLNNMAKKINELIERENAR